MKYGEVVEEPYMISIELTTNCPLNCPFCYSRRRYHDRNTRWDQRLLKIFLEEVSSILGEGRFVTGFGGGEPLTVPKLLAYGLKYSLDYGARYTSFTTNAILFNHNSLSPIEEAIGILKMPDGFVTISIDSYKLLVSPRARYSIVGIDKLWRNIKPLLSYAGRRHGLKIPDKPPIQFEAIEKLWSKGYSLALNIMVTDDLLPLLLPPVIGFELDAYTFIEYVNGRFIQVQFLLPKPMKGLLSIKPGILKRIINWWANRSRIKVAVDQAMHYFIGLGMTGRDGKFCLAGSKLLSIDPYMSIAPCSYAPHIIRWKPGNLKNIMNELVKRAPDKTMGCPYI